MMSKLLKAIGLPGWVLFQAEDGIRDGRVTGVQTCALPISAVPSSSSLTNYFDTRKSYTNPIPEAIQETGRRYSIIIRRKTSRTIRIKKAPFLVFTAQVLPKCLVHASIVFAFR